MKLAKTDFEDLAQFLKEQPEQEKQFVAARQIIEAHKTELRRLIRVKNYTYEQVAELLAKKGLQISPNTLKGYLARKRSSKKDIAQSMDDGDEGDKEDRENRENKGELQNSHHFAREQHPKQHPKKDVNGTVNKTKDSIPVPTSSSNEHLKPVKNSTSTKIEQPPQSTSSVAASLQSSLQADTEPLVQPDSKPQAEPITTAESPEEQQQASTGSSDIYARMRASRS